MRLDCQGIVLKNQEAGLGIGREALCIHALFDPLQPFLSLLTSGGAPQHGLKLCLGPGQLSRVQVVFAARQRPLDIGFVQVARVAAHFGGRLYRRPLRLAWVRRLLDWSRRGLLPAGLWPGGSLQLVRGLRICIWRRRRRGHSRTAGVADWQPRGFVMEAGHDQSSHQNDSRRAAEDEPLPLPEFSGKSRAIRGMTRSPASVDSSTRGSSSGTSGSGGGTGRGCKPDTGLEPDTAREAETGLETEMGREAEMGLEARRVEAEPRSVRVLVPVGRDLPIPVLRAVAAGRSHPRESSGQPRRFHTTSRHGVSPASPRKDREGCRAAPPCCHG